MNHTPNPIHRNVQREPQLLPTFPASAGLPQLQQAFDGQVADILNRLGIPEEMQADYVENLTNLISTVFDDYFNHKAKP